MSYCTFCFSCLNAKAQNPVVFTVQTDKPLANVASTMWGIFFEDINLGADGGIYASGVLDKNSKELILKIVNTASKSINALVRLNGAGSPASNASLTVLSNNNLEAVNSLDNPFAVAPSERTIAISNNQVELALLPYSVSVIKVRLQ